MNTAKFQMLQRAYERYIASMRAQGCHLLAFYPPCCGRQTLTLAAPRGETWDTLSTCPHCAELYMKITTHAQVTCRVPEPVIEPAPNPVARALDRGTGSWLSAP